MATNMSKHYYLKIVLFIYQLICAILCDPKHTRGDFEDIFSSTFQMQSLLRAELDFVKQLNKSDYETTLKREEIKNFKNFYYSDENFVISKDLESYVSHPVNAFGVISRTSQARQLFHETSLVNYTTIFPPLMDFIHVCGAILMIQESHDLKTKHLAQGDIVLKNHEIFSSSFKPSFYEISAIASVAGNNQYYDLSIEWFQNAFKNEKNVSEKLKKEAVTNYKKVVQFHDKYLDKHGPIGQNHRCFPVPFDQKLRQKKKYKKLLKKPLEKVAKPRNYFPLFDKSVNSRYLMDNTFFVCKEGEKWRTPEHDQYLKCFNLHHSDPFLKLGPFKIEEKNQDPFVAIFHDIMSEAEISHFRQISEQNLKRSTYGGNVKNGGIFRTSKQTWFHDRSYDIPQKYMELSIPKGVENPYEEGYISASDMIQIPVLPPNMSEYRSIVDTVAYKFTQRIGLATQLYLLGVFSSESYQVANYGIGGQYGTHFDASGFVGGAKSKKNSEIYNMSIGDRIATFMAYLSDVQVGGNTAFPLLGISVKPRKGDAVFWINVKQNGQIDRLTSHAGCPMIVGSKWITNKWINYYDQYEKFPCSLDKNIESFEAYQKYRAQNASLGTFYQK